MDNINSKNSGVSAKEVIEDINKSFEVDVRDKWFYVKIAVVLIAAVMAISSIMIWAIVLMNKNNSESKVNPEFIAAVDNNKTKKITRNSSVNADLEENEVFYNGDRIKESCSVGKEEELRISASMLAKMTRTDMNMYKADLACEIKVEDKLYYIAAGSNEFYINKKKKYLDAPAVMCRGELYIPISILNQINKHSSQRYTYTIDENGDVYLGSCNDRVLEYANNNCFVLSATTGINMKNVTHYGEVEVKNLYDEFRYLGSDYSLDGRWILITAKDAAALMQFDDSNLSLKRYFAADAKFTEDKSLIYWGDDDDKTYYDYRNNKKVANADIDEKQVHYRDKKMDLVGKKYSLEIRETASLFVIVKQKDEEIRYVNLGKLMQKMIDEDEGDNAEIQVKWLSKDTFAIWQKDKLVIVNVLDNGMFFYSLAENENQFIIR